MTAIKRRTNTGWSLGEREGPARKSLQPHHTHSRRALCKELAAHWHNSGAKGLTIETVDGMRRLDEKLIFTMRESCLLQHHDEEASRPADARTVFHFCQSELEICACVVTVWV